VATRFRLEETYAAALASSRVALGERHVEVAYHFLMAALHCAEDLRDTGRLSEVVELAHEQQKAIDALSPPHRLATQSAHGPLGVFETAARTAAVAARGLESREWLAKHQRHLPGRPCDAS
jgi:hypothetical protein